MMKPRRAWEAVEVAIVDVPAELSTALLDLTGLSLTDLRSLNHPDLGAAIHHTIDATTAGWLAGSIQGQRD